MLSSRRNSELLNVTSRLLMSAMKASNQSLKKSIYSG